MMRTIFFVIAALTAISWYETSPAQTSAEYAQMGLTLRSAFLCSTWAEVSGDEPEHVRLFQFGYETAQVFLDGVREGRINSADAIDEIPISSNMTLGGPSPDFVVGRLYEASAQRAYDELLGEDGLLPLPEMLVNNAASRYLTSNCRVLGRE